MIAAWAWFKGVSLFWKLAPLIGLVALALGGVYLVQRLTIAELRADLTAAERDAAIYEEAGRRTAESFGRYIEDTERSRRIVAEATARERESAAELGRLTEDINRDPDGAAPAGALADSVLDRLRAIRAAGN